MHIFFLPCWSLQASLLALQRSCKEAAKRIFTAEVWSLKCHWGQWHLYGYPEQVLFTPVRSAWTNISYSSNFPERVTHAPNSCVWSVLAPILSCNFVATMKWLWVADEVPWLASWLFFERGVPDFFEIVECYEDEIRESKIQPKRSTLTLSSFFGLTYETKKKCNC